MLTTTDYEAIADEAENAALVADAAPEKTWDDYVAEGRAWVIANFHPKASVRCNEYALNQSAREYARMNAPLAMIRARDAARKVLG